MSDTIAAVATGAQVCAIGIVRLSGPACVAAADRLFTPYDGRPMSSHPTRKLVYGKLRNLDGALLDLCLCTFSLAPASYTGEDTVEFQCHGSPVLLRTLMEELFKLGIRQAGRGEFTKRAFLNGRLGLTEAEAVIDVIEAESAECVVNAASQLDGAVSSRIERIYSSLTDISAHYHAVLDYPDEDIEDFVLDGYISALQSAVSDLQSLLDTFDRGSLMKDGIPAAIVGRPNAGKSSLLNSLLGYERAIVTNVPGTTRDTIEEKLLLGGVLLRLTDTAGIRETSDEIERMGVSRSRRAMEHAELVLAVIDGSRELTGEDTELIKCAERAPHGIVILSKHDLGSAAAVPETALPVVELSSVTGEGLKELEDTVRELFPEPSAPAGEILTNARQFDAVSRALESMKAAEDAMKNGCTPDIVLTETETAMAALGELTGRTVREEVTNRIFERFCVGK